jgi:hypothetical protein
MDTDDFKVKVKKRQSLVLQLSDLEQDEEEEEEEVKIETVEQKEETVFEGAGYLSKKKEGHHKWDRRYFAVIKGKMYWYVNDRSREP